jgi:hypothetical protein
MTSVISFHSRQTALMGSPRHYQIQTITNLSKNGQTTKTEFFCYLHFSSLTFSAKKNLWFGQKGNFNTASCQSLLIQ